MVNGMVDRMIANKPYRTIGGCVAALVLMTGCRTMSVLPPVAKVDPTYHTIHGETRADPYGWLRNRGSADVLAYLEAENDHTKCMMSRCCGGYEPGGGGIRYTGGSAAIKLVVPILRPLFLRRHVAPLHLPS